MAARVQIVVEAKDATAGVFRAITSELGSFGGLMEELTAKNVSWGNVGQMAAQMVISGLKDAINTTTEYAREVRDLSLASGQSAEESSRMLQVLDDYQLSADDAKTATRALTNEGLAPTIDTIANLSAQFQQLTSVEERNAFVQKNLGRAGQEWLNLLSQGPDKIRAMNAAVSEGLILTEENVKASEKYRLALDEFNDGVEAVKVSIGTRLLPVLTQMMEGLLRSSEIHKEANRLMMEGAAGNREEALAMAAATIEAKANAEAMQENALATDTATQSATELEAAEKAAAEAAKTMNSENLNFLSTLTNVTAAEKTYRDGQADVIQAYRDGSITADEYGLKMAALKDQHQASINSMVLDLLKMKMTADGTFDDTDLENYLKAAEKFGVITAEDRKKTIELYKEVDVLHSSLTETEQPMLHVGKRAEDADVAFGGLARASAELGESLRKDAASGAAAVTSSLLSIPTSIDVFVNIHTRGSVPMYSNAGGGGAGQNIAQAMQQGGEVFAGMPYNVGEGGSEPFIPAMDGRIIGHKAALHQAGLMGGGASRNYFYGPVTIMSDSETGGDFMSIR